MSAISLREESGMTLIEIIIAGAIVLVVALGMATLLSSASKTESNVRLKQEQFLSDQEWDYNFKISPPPKPNP